MTPDATVTVTWLADVGIVVGPDDDDDDDDAGPSLSSSSIDSDSDNAVAVAIAIMLGVLIVVYAAVNLRRQYSRAESTDLAQQSTAI